MAWSILALVEMAQTTQPLETERVKANQDTVPFRNQYPLNFTQDLMRLAGTIQRMAGNHQIQILESKRQLLGRAKHTVLFALHHTQSETAGNA